MARVPEVKAQKENKNLYSPPGFSPTGKINKISGGENKLFPFPPKLGFEPEGETGEKEKTSKKKSFPGFLAFSAPLTFFIIFTAWEALSFLKVYPPFILPSPREVAGRLVDMALSGSLWKHSQVTVLEALLGFGLAFFLVSLLCYPIAHSRLVAALLSPFLAATQAIPLVAVAPLLVIWFGFGLLPKIITCTLIVFFPLLLNAVSGLRSLDKTLLEAAQVFGASRWQTFWLVELPLSLPYLLTGIKIGFTVAITGAVVGEFISADAGLGYLLNLGRGQFDTVLVFVALLSLTAIAILAYGLIVLIEKQVLKWY